MDIKLLFHVWVRGIKKCFCSLGLVYNVQKNTCVEVYTHVDYE